MLRPDQWQVLPFQFLFYSYPQANVVEFISKLMATQFLHGQRHLACINYLLPMHFILGGNAIIVTSTHKEIRCK